MTSTVAELTIIAISSNAYESLSTALGVIVILLLLVLLIQKELIRALGGSRSGTWVQALNTAIVPLLVTFGFVMVMRVLGLLFSE